MTNQSFQAHNAPTRRLDNQINGNNLLRYHVMPCHATTQLHLELIDAPLFHERLRFMLPQQLHHKITTLRIRVAIGWQLA